MLFWGSCLLTGGKPRPSARVEIHMPHQQEYVDELVDTFALCFHHPKPGVTTLGTLLGPVLHVARMFRMPCADRHLDVAEAPVVA